MHRFQSNRKSTRIQILCTYMIFVSMMDTATQVDGVLVIRLLRDAELECIETIAAMFANIITPMVI